MDHLRVIREKVASLRDEIAQLQELNDRYRFQSLPDAQDHFAHVQRQERLLEIQEELIQLARLGGRFRSIEHLKEQHRSRPYLANKAS